MALKKRTHKILFVCTEDWFFCSHFLPLIKAARGIENAEILLATRIGDKRAELEVLGVKLIPVDFDRASMKGVSAVKLLLRLSKAFQREKPDIIHFIALKPIIIGGLAARLSLGSAKAYHLTGQGFFSLSNNSRHETLRRMFLRTITWYLRRPRSWLFIENPDDVSELRKYGNFPKNRQTILGGAGVNADQFPAQDTTSGDVVHLGFVGRLVWSKGVDVLIKAMDLVHLDGVRYQLDLYGSPDCENPRALSEEQLHEWSERDDVTWQGRSENVVEVWRRADMAVVPSRGGEGMPRAMLEAACCARPLIVTDVPGCRQFVRNGVEGYVVPPEDPQALAEAIQKLAGDASLRQKMGQAARQRVLGGFTEQHVIDDIVTVYRQLL